ncbi:energy-coupling factor ABC transporter ATP-binding protein [Clostridium sporogenes]|uniref:ABC transporter ATP-binding protein n=2 Tax=Clostridium sporogenes TaxID=1509 RepID=UPI0013D313D1|nr:energy-coupling factor ABC transporter ATP-binding protein [Clostridium sporogenes]NFG97120.1 energy-coupling factor ABC transporter ATP-binding protein [Clostridium sporogenes]NFH31848.1 energy-coupling factor ABC transporter ATP-binding protein [Clostridium sporogenes]NFL20327.1 energy-coupling factor ABC transporter ATP-binding protein [Clostridium sporogenes]NFN73494.1 energy-coupling factor ABC transporter ATP-binding protein [Clostridium sporogenes]NFV21063.1 energy-coupling factor AB
MGKDGDDLMIRLENISYSYSKETGISLKNINLTVKAGEFVVLTGKSGCGKTTLTRVINGLATKFYDGRLTGKVFINNKDLKPIPLWQIGKTVGSIFQDPRSQFFASLTEDEIAFGCENYGLHRSIIEKRIDNAIDKIGGQGLIGKQIYPMSSGEKQKIAIASVYAVNPFIYVFDEPSANLDMESVTKLKELMAMLKEKGHTVIVAEHRLYYLTELVDRFLYMNEGRIICEYTSEQMKNLNFNEVKYLGLRTSSLESLPYEGETALCSGKPSMETENIYFSYKKNNIFSDLTIKAYAGDIIALIGHNGVGKTTLCKILCGLIKEQSGDVLFKGKPIKMRKRKDFAYFVGQNTDSQLFGESVEEELSLNKPNYIEKREIQRILKEYDLWEYKSRHPASLSGGQKQRLTLAVADMINPNIFILDEPTSGLDGENMRRISSHLKDLSKKGKTILVITHDYEFALSTCNRAIKIANGSSELDFPIKNNSQKLFSCMLDSNGISE